ncbi:MAG: 50S ribosomal protein L11 methyltransferase [Holosporaceae bacterium]|jgi:ribosomal protein L11 methyltransferase|nr:50S ribosomal protein L11 methyltransferase [Holosporaceae bacterium]
MNQKFFKHTIGNFNIKDAFEATDLLFERGYMSVSCAEKSGSWIVEIINDRPVSESEIFEILRQYHFSGTEISELEDTDWLKKCFENFKPLCIGEFYIYGPHVRGNPVPEDKIPLEIAAATAFGTGEHPTTDRCLLACQTFFDEKRHRSVMDIGCGSGILSIALAKSGADRIDACDVEEEAVRISRENIAVNGVAHKINVFLKNGSEINGEKYDFITANILAEPLVSMNNAVVSAMSDGAVLILSGFTSDDDTVPQRYLASGLNLKFRYDLNGWTTLVLGKRF